MELQEIQRDSGNIPRLPDQYHRILARTTRLHPHIRFPGSQPQPESNSQGGLLVEGQKSHAVSRGPPSTEEGGVEAYQIHDPQFLPPG